MFSREGTKLFDPETRSWWESLPLSALELYRLQSDLDALEFAKAQVKRLECCLAEFAARDPRMPLLVQLPGIGLINGVTILAAIGDITRFPDAKSLVGYAGLGARAHLSGTLNVTGRITTAGRRDLRRSMVEAAHHAVECSPHWKAEFERLEKRKGRSKSVIAVGRMLLVALWHILSKAEADRHAAEHYEPLECPIEKNPLSPQRINPTTALFKEYKFTTCDPRFPFVATTYRVTEHWQTGLMTRYQSWLVEAEPQMFVELSEELAELRGIKNGERVSFFPKREGGNSSDCNKTLEAS